MHGTYTAIYGVLSEQSVGLSQPKGPSVLNARNVIAWLKFGESAQACLLLLPLGFTLLDVLWRLGLALFPRCLFDRLLVGFSCRLDSILVHRTFLTTNLTVGLAVAVVIITSAATCAIQRIACSPLPGRRCQASICDSRYILRSRAVLGLLADAVKQSRHGPCSRQVCTHACDGLVVHTLDVRAPSSQHTLLVALIVGHLFQAPRNESLLRPGTQERVGMKGCIAGVPTTQRWGMRAQDHNISRSPWHSSTGLWDLLFTRLQAHLSENVVCNLLLISSHADWSAAGRHGRFTAGSSHVSFLGAWQALMVCRTG
eukprot:355524-Chlamydomonas_euryale.AAC.29